MRLSRIGPVTRHLTNMCDANRPGATKVKAAQHKSRPRR